MISVISQQNNRSNVNFGAKLTVIGSQTPKARSVSYNDYARTKADEYMNNGHYDKAVEYYKQSLSVNPQNYDTHLNLAKTYTYNNQYDKAVSHLRTYLDANPDDIENITLLGECYKKIGKLSDAQDCFNRALSIEPHYDYARRNLLDTENLKLSLIDPNRAAQERYNDSIKNLTNAVKIAKEFLPKGYTNNMKDITVSFDKTSKMGGRSNIAQYEHAKRKISVTDEYTYADPKLTGAYLIHEFVHGKDNDPYTSIREEQDAYRVQAQYWTQNVKDVYDPEMDYVADLYKQSAQALDERVAEIYKLRDPSIPEVSYNHPPTGKSAAAYSLSSDAGQALKAYEIIV